MMTNVLLNLIYLFYPREICAQNEVEKYVDSNENKNLLEIINYFQKEENTSLYKNLEEIFKNDDILKNFRSAFLLDWQDRSIGFNLSIIEKRELYTISLYLSILIPFYTIRVQKNKIEYYFSNSEIDQWEKNHSDSRRIEDLIFDISTIVENKILYKKFPDELLNLTVDDVSFQEIPFGKFNMFNAFFNNLMTNEIENNNTFSF